MASEQIDPAEGTESGAQPSECLITASAETTLGRDHGGQAPRFPPEQPREESALHFLILAHGRSSRDLLEGELLAAFPGSLFSESPVSGNRAHALSQSNADVVVAELPINGFNLSLLMSGIRSQRPNVPLLALIHPDTGDPPAEELPATLTFFVPNSNASILASVVRYALQAAGRQAEIGREVSQVNNETAERPGVSEAQIHLLAEAAACAIFFIQDEQFRYVNRAAEDLTGYTREELLSMGFNELIHPSHREMAQRRSLALQEGQTPSQWREFKIVTKQGEERWLDVRGALTQMGGQPGVLGTAFDITERKQAEEAVEESAKKYRVLFDLNPFPMWLFDAETLAFLEVNDAAVASYGYSREEFLKMTLLDIRPPQEIPNLHKALQGRDGKIAMRLLSRHKTKDGRLLTVEISTEEATFAGRRATLVIAHDISEETRAREEEARFRAILDATPDLVAITAIEGPASYVNPAGRRMLGVGPDDRVLLSSHRPLHERERVMSEILPITTRHGAWTGESVYLGKDGCEIPVSQVIIAHKDRDGDVEFLSTIARDMTERRQLEDQLRQSQKMESIGTLAGGVAHDFNNLLTGILGFAEIGKADLPDGHSVKPILGEIEQLGQRAARLTRQLLAFARKQVLERRPVNLNLCVSDLSKLLRRVIGEHIEYELSLAPDLDTVYADVSELEQVLMNLAVNARDAMPQGGKLLIETSGVTFDEHYCRAHLWARPGQYAQLSVSDTGTGMSREVLDRIFDPFFTTKEPGQGTGLGLAMVYGIMKQHDGMINVYSEPGHGTRFSLYFPSRPGEEAVVQTAEEPHAAGGSENILVVEDEESVRDLLVAVLRKQGYRVHTCPDGEAAQQLLGESAAAYDLVISDVVMPKVGGKQLYEFVRQHSPSSEFLFISGYSLSLVNESFLANHHVEILEKPFRPQDLISKVRAILDNAVKRS